MAALARSIVEVDLETHEVTCVCEPDLHPDEMFNDGKLDKQGRLWVATKDINEASPIANLYCFDGRVLACKQQDVIVGNGIDWSTEGTTMYFTDSPRQTIYQYDFDVTSGSLSHRKKFVKVSRGYPDGLCVDNKDNVWSAHWDGACITCYSPSGEILKVIDLPCQRPTSCCFGGEEREELFITSASVGLELNADGSDGYVFIL